jgi:hypothetical protein
MGKKIKHMKMSLTEEEHKRWHREHQEITPEQHKTLMEKMGISKEEDKKWHKSHEIPNSSKEQKSKPINPYAVGGGFLAYCVKQEWLIQKGKGRTTKYYATKKGINELKKFGISI